MNATHETPAENLQSGPNKKCADPECISGFIDIYQIAPDGSIMCKTHARAAWFQYRLKVNPTSVRPSANPAPRPTKNPFASLSKLSGVMIQYPGYFHLKDGVRSIWTKTRCYPYPDKRKKLGMAGSYPDRSSASSSTGASTRTRRRQNRRRCRDGGTTERDPTLRKQRDRPDRTSPGKTAYVLKGRLRRATAGNCKRTRSRYSRR
jgi:hypothetical protein